MPKETRLYRTLANKTLPTFTERSKYGNIEHFRTYLLTYTVYGDRNTKHSTPLARTVYAVVRRSENLSCWDLKSNRQRADCIHHLQHAHAHF